MHYCIVSIGVSDLSDIFKYWIEYEGVNGQKARKILTTTDLKAQIGTHLASCAKYMESHMVFSGGEPVSDIFKCTFFHLFSLTLSLILFLNVPC